MSINFVRVDIVHLPRSCNIGAHDLARIGLNWDPDQSHVWIDDPLPEFVTLGVRDVNEPSKKIRKYKPCFQKKNTRDSTRLHKSTICRGERVEAAGTAASKVVSEPPL